MKKILILLTLVVAIPLLTYAVDSFNYDRTINIPSIAASGETNTEEGDDTVCAEDLTGNGGPHYLRVTLAETEGADYRRVDESFCSETPDRSSTLDDSGDTTGGNTEGDASTTDTDAPDDGSTFQGTTTISAYTIVDNKEYPVNTAKVEATTNVTTGDNGGVRVVGDCITNLQGQCDMKINSPFADLDFVGNEIINYTALKGESIGRKNATFANSTDKTIKIQIDGLTREMAEEYIDWTEASPQNLQIPGTRGFPGGNASVTIVPTRYTTIGGTNNSTPIGGVEFKLQVYYSASDAQTGSATMGDAPPSYQSTIGSFSYTTRNTLSSLLGNTKKYSFSGTIPDNGPNSRLQLSNLPAGRYLLSLNKEKFQTTTVTFELNNAQKKTLNDINLRPKKGAEQPSTSQGNTVRRIADVNVYWVNIGGSEYLYDPNYPWYGWQKKDGYITQEPTYDIGTNYEPTIPMGPFTTGGYDTPWGQNPSDYANYIRRCQTANYTGSADPESAAIATAIGGLGTFLGIDSRDQNLQSFAETTLIPGLGVYFATKAMGDTGESLSVTTGNEDCYGISPFLNNNYDYNRYYPNNYPTSNIPSRCRVCFENPYANYLVDPCPEECRVYRTLSNSLPVLDILGQFGINF